MLKSGMIIQTAQNGLCEVIFVNESRAKIRPLTTRKVKIKTLLGKTIEFEAKQRCLNISPNSEVLIIKEKGVVKK